ncbi:MAG TPA: hypothetical protein VD838_21575, partial [Anaeromyxobacteraceae bacterium]|nr:hypothetical protein [Anaeromyxobacteraceae bacterium]
MLRILLTASDGGTAWRHAFAPDEARAGWECVGPLGLAKRLGRLYGLRGEPAPHADRVSAYAARLPRLEAGGARAFSRSRAQDPWGVAAFLLGLRDALRAAGWDRGAIAGSPRLEDLAAAERLEAPGLSPLPPGLADVLADLLAEIERTEALPEPLAIEVAAPDVAFDPIVRRVLAALARKSAAVAPAAPPRASAPESSDLGRLQRALLASAAGKPGPALAGDGSVVVLEADTALEAAELAASYLRSRALDATTIVTGPDARALELALARNGLSALGTDERSRWRPALQVLPLRLALAFAPRDPFRAAELLMLPVTPIPPDAQRRLLDALVEQPGVGGPMWREAIAEACARAAERARRVEPDRADAAAAEAEVALRERVEAWFGGTACDPREGIPASDAIRLCEAVARWAEGRARVDETPDAALQAAARIARTLARMLAEQPGDVRLTPVQLEQLHEVAAGDGVDS